MNIYRKCIAIVICIMAVASIIFVTNSTKDDANDEKINNKIVIETENTIKEIEKEIASIKKEVKEKEKTDVKNDNESNDQEKDIIQEDIKVNDICENETYILNKTIGEIINCEGFTETYYNMDMTGVISRAKERGIVYEYWVRDDGVKMYGDYVIVATDWDVVPYGSTVHTSLGDGISLDTGEFTEKNPYQIDVAVSWGTQAN